MRDQHASKNFAGSTTRDQHASKNFAGSTMRDQYASNNFMNDHNCYFAL
jgi:hypothetical protein